MESEHARKRLEQRFSALMQLALEFFLSSDDTCQTLDVQIRFHDCTLLVILEP